MTAPVDLSALVPSKAKTWVGLVGSVVSFVLPFALESADLLPTPWPAVLGALAAVLTALGIYKAPYRPRGTVLAVDPTEKPVERLPEGTPVAVAVEETVEYRNPWK